MKDHVNPARRGFLGALASLVAVPVCALSTRTASANQKKTYKYRCPKCKLIQEYGTMGPKKCPNDGATMIRMN